MQKPRTCAGLYSFRRESSAFRSDQLESWFDDAFNSSFFCDFHCETGEREFFHSHFTRKVHEVIDLDDSFATSFIIEIESINFNHHLGGVTPDFRGLCQSRQDEGGKNGTGDCESFQHSYFPFLA
jgi:hypothetical protein